VRFSPAFIFSDRRREIDIAVSRCGRRGKIAGPKIGRFPKRTENAGVTPFLDDASRSPAQFQAIQIFRARAGTRTIFAPQFARFLWTPD
jgi:hypothetical protein